MVKLRRLLEVAIERRKLLVCLEKKSQCSGEPSTMEGPKDGVRTGSHEVCVVAA
jgi:hypothetical protein